MSKHGGMGKRAVCVGINEYPTASLALRGCVNDAEGWAALLTEHFDFARADVRLITDADATKATILGALDDLLAGASSGDVLVFTNSSHGTYRVDESRDDDVYDEALVPYDGADDVILDDELRERLGGLGRGVRATVILDSCHSGSGTRDAGDLEHPDRRARFCDPRQLGRQALDDVRESARPRRGAESQMGELLLAGSRADQYSFDDRFGDRFEGAMSHYAKALIRDAGYGISYARLHEQLGAALRDAQFEQDPQLEGRTTAKRRQVFT
jgi:hypothetical protein